MNIINQSKNFDKKEAYKLTHSRSTSLKDAIGVTLNVEAWLIFEDTNSRGEEQQVLMLVDADGEFYSTISPTFTASFLDIIENFGTPIEVVTISGVTKAGRDFVDCQLA